MSRRNKMAALSLLLFVLMPSFFAQTANVPKNSSNAQSKQRVSSKGSAQKSTGSTAGQTLQNQANTPAQQSALTSKLTSSVLDQQPELSGDYIPCKFTLAELRALQAPEIALTLSPADEEKLKQTVISTVISETGGMKTSGSVVSAFIDKVAHQSLVGLTPSQALNVVIALLQDFNVNEAKNIDRATQGDVDEILDAISSVMPQSRPAGMRKYYEHVRTAIFDPSNPKPLSRENVLDKVISDFPDWASESAPEITPADIALAKLALLNLKKQDSDTEREKAQGTASIVDAARRTLATLTRPSDVGCAMSILTWSEVDHAYGHLIADEYIAIQVVVRNLNKNQQFVLHDVEFAVNSDPTGRFGRFFSGRDKVIVRALASAQTSFDPRNIIVHSAQGIGSLLSATASVFGGNVVDASGVFNGAFTTGLDKYWKDLSGEQLNLLNDTGFSSSNNSQTVVPQSATVMFATFIPSKQFEEGWWTQPCVETQYLGSIDRKGHLVNLAKGFYNPVHEARMPKNGSSIATNDSPIGIDVGRALETCIYSDKLPRHQRHFYTLGFRRDDKQVVTISKDKFGRLPNEKGNDPSIGNEGDEPNKNDATGKPSVEQNQENELKMDIFRNAYPKPYKKWPGTSLAIFREISSIVVSGMHIVDENQLKPSIEQLKCPTDSQGNISLKDAKDAVSCTLTGKNLDKYEKLRLRSVKNPTDPNTVESTVFVTGDSSTATVSFAVSALRSLKDAAYLVYGVDTHGVETKTSQAVHLSQTPEATAVTPAELDFTSSAAPQTIVISGSNLGNMNKLEMKDKGGKTKVLDAVAGSTSPSQLSFNIDPVKLPEFAASQTEVSLTLTDDSGKTRVPIDLKLILKGIQRPANPSAPAPKSTPNPNAKKPIQAPQKKGAPK